MTSELFTLTERSIPRQFTLNIPFLELSSRRKRQLQKVSTLRSRSFYCLNPPSLLPGGSKVSRNSATIKGSKVIHYFMAAGLVCKVLTVFLLAVTSRVPLEMKNLGYNSSDGSMHMETTPTPTLTEGTVLIKVWAGAGNYFMCPGKQAAHAL